ncbi:MULTISPECIES: hypothetical protein [Nocardiopsis]|uniref:DUF2631 domain-containing protein n=1 Tax=Nocardiopsis sinuspersici TaxID=501010 RepID=A0A1V3C654_9ACTN|nr:MULTISPECIES: hypothetical protein [Nocardiopsis]OOC56251.1 hypothetical protein NOSIN_22495 [Nocardiopsis sinuspersici]
MSDPYRFARSSGDAGRRHDGTPSRQGRYATRAVLWLLIILGATANAVTSFGSFHPLISVGFGLLTVLCIVLLVMHHLRHRK